MSICEREMPHLLLGKSDFDGESEHKSNTARSDLIRGLLQTYGGSAEGGWINVVLASEIQVLLYFLGF